MKENENTMEYTQMHDVLKHIEDTSISDETKITVLKELSSHKIVTSNYLTKDDFRNGMNWLLRYMEFKQLYEGLKYIALEKRMKHLLLSPYIRSFDEVNPVTKEYMRDINDAGKLNADVVDSITAMIPTVCETITAIIEKPGFIDEVVNMITENPDKFINRSCEEPDDTLTYYTTTCTSCGKVSPIGDYCIWCGEKGTCLESCDKK